MGVIYLYIDISYYTFCCVVSLSIFTSCAYFDEPLGRVKIQTMSKNSQRYYTTKRLIRYLLSNTTNCYVISRIFICGECVSSGVQISRDICTRFGRYLYSTKCSWIIIVFILLHYEVRQSPDTFNKTTKKIERD